MRLSPVRGVFIEVVRFELITIREKELPSFMVLASRQAEIRSDQALYILLQAWYNLCQLSQIAVNRVYSPSHNCLA